jgi:hypothetical protein
MKTALAALLLLTAACSGATPGDAADTGAAEWTPTTVPYDPACTGCQEVGRAAMGHHGEQVISLLVDPAVDDPVAQWGDCVEAVLTCLEGGGGMRACAGSEACPAGCRQRFDDETAGVLDEVALKEAFEGVYITRGAPCRPVDPNAPSPDAPSPGPEVTP